MMLRFLLPLGLLLDLLGLPGWLLINEEFGFKLVFVKGLTKVKEGRRPFLKI